MDLTKEARERAIASIKRYAREELELDLGDLRAALVLDFVLKEIAPAVYNEAVRDARKHLQEKLDDMDGVVYQPEFGYWKK